FSKAGTSIPTCAGRVSGPVSCGRPRTGRERGGSKRSRATRPSTTTRAFARTLRSASRRSSGRFASARRYSGASTALESRRLRLCSEPLTCLRGEMKPRKNKLWTAALSLVSLWLAASCANATRYPEGYADDRAAIMDLQARYVLALDYFDADGYAAVFAEDGVLDWARGKVEG